MTPGSRPASSPALRARIWRRSAVHGRCLHRHGGDRPGVGADFSMVDRRHDVLRAQRAAQRLRGAEAPLAAQAAQGRDQVVDLDVGARRGLGRRRHAHRRGPRRQRLRHQRPEAVGDRRRRQEQRHQRLREDRPQGALPPGHVAVPGRQRHARASSCASSTCSAGAAPAPTRSSSTTCASAPSG